MKKNKETNALVMEVVNNQIRDNNPPITKKTLERLKAEGFTEKDAKMLIGDVVWAEIFAIIESSKVFSLERFSAALEYLPEFPWKDK